MELTIHMYNSNCQIVPRLTPSLSAEIDAMLAFGVEGAKFTEQYINNQWDGLKHMYSPSKQAFPTGYLMEVVTLLKERGIVPALDDRREPPGMSEHPIVLQGRDPWKHQIETFHVIAANSRGLVQIATGGGKTLCIAGAYAIHNQPGIVLTYRKELMMQLRKELQGFLGEPVGIFGDGQWEEGRLTVCMAQSLLKATDVKYAKLVKEFDEKDEGSDRLIAARKLEIWDKLIKGTRFVAVDEVHHVGANSSYSLIQNMGQAFYRFGFSATAFGFREDKRDFFIKSALGDVIKTVTTSDLVDAGILVPTDVIMVDFSHKGRHYPKDTYNEYYYKAVVENDERNKILVQTAYHIYKSGKPVLMAVQRVDHGKMLELAMQHLVGEEHAKFVYGEDHSTYRDETLAAFKAGKLPILISTLISEGVDIPCVAGDTKVKLINGTIKTVKELYDCKLTNFEVYSCTSAGQIQPAKAEKVICTKPDAAIVKVTLDSGESFKCTPDHLILCKDGSYAPASQLQPGDSLMPLYTKKASYGYELVFNPATRSQIFTHRLVGEYYHGKQEYGPGNKVFHHINFNKLDNRVDNLKLMSFTDHNRYHSQEIAAVNHNNWQNPDYRCKMTTIKKRVNSDPIKCKKQSAAIKKLWEERGAGYKTVTEQSLEATAAGVKRAWARGDFEGKRAKINSLKRVMPTRDAFVQEYIMVGGVDGLCNKYSCCKPTIHALALSVGIKHIRREVTWPAIKAGKLKPKIVHRSLAAGAKISKTKKLIAAGVITKETIAEWRTKYRSKGVSLFDYIGLRNHKVVSVTMCPSEAVYDIVGVNPNNNFALACGVFVHNCLGHVVAGRGESSRIATIQLMGRGMRSFPGKTKAVYVDIMDHHSTWLARHTHTRDAAYGAERAFTKIPVDVKQLGAFLQGYQL